MRGTAPIDIVGSFSYAFSSWPRLRTEVLAGLVVGLALIPEAISFSILAGLDPATGLYTSVAMAIVGLMESLMTAQLTDDITDTRSPKTRESWGQGVANISSGLIGGMGGCAMIGQTMINVRKSGARTRLSTLLAGVFLLILVVGLGEWVGLIPMAALVAVMIDVSISTVDWDSLKPSRLRVMPRSETLAMLVTVVGTLATDNLAIGVILGVLTAMIAFATNVSRVAHVTRTEPGHYAISGPLFWASTNEMQHRFNYAVGKEHVVLDFTEAEILDASAVTALDSVRRTYEENGTTVEYRGLNEKSDAILRRLSEV